MWSLLRNWWHDGESPGAVVFKHSIWTPLLGVLALVVVIWFAPGLQDWIGYLALGLGSLRALLERRRALIFCADKVGMRQALAPAYFVPLDQVSGIEKTTVAMVYLLKPIYTVGVKLSRRAGEPVYVPLDFPRRKEISARFDEIARHLPSSAPAAVLPQSKS